MLTAQWYRWMEGVPEEHVRNRTREVRKRVAVDVLLSGPTTLEQIRAAVLPHRRVQIKYKPPQTYLTARLLVARLSMQFVRHLGTLHLEQSRTMTGRISFISCTQDHEHKVMKLLLKILFAGNNPRLL